MERILKLSDCIDNNRLELKVKVNAGKTRVISYSPLIIGVKALPEGGKANSELSKFLSKELGKPVKLLVGGSSRKKVFKIL